ncbi:MAG: hypothetical protein VKM34_02565, partial [Cyanobacteriota bacterium]|nr:hypothetical protein [Cyanobacteriota bacterium]
MLSLQLAIDLIDAAQAAHQHWQHLLFQERDPLFSIGLQVSEAELATAAVRDLVARQSADFQAADDRLLNKNQELYR